MRLPAILMAVLLPVPALAHPGHLADLAGHDHWIALGALGVAGIIALLAGRKKPADQDAQDDADDAPEAEEGETA